MGIRASLIAVAVLAILVFIGVVMYAILDATGLLNKNKAQAERYPCLASGDCGAYWGLPSNYVCDPKLKQCRMRSYQSRTCSKDGDCLEITPHCAPPPAVGLGPMCSHDPYTAADLFGDPTRATPGCGSGLLTNTTWNFCQLDIGGTCKTTDECGRGACVGGTCQYLGPFAVCTEESSYANNQCSPPTVCAANPKFILEASRCQPPGIAPGQDHAYCLKNSDCDNHDCYFAFPGDPVGVCASSAALVGMSCQHGADCVQGLDCAIPSGQTSGTCVLSDPQAQTVFSHCPAGQYSFAAAPAGCGGALPGVPCSDINLCANQCGFGGPQFLILGFLGPDQVWNPIYPQQFQSDSTGVFTQLFTFTGGIMKLNINFTLLVSPSMLTAAKPEIYPTITLIPDPPTTDPTPVVLDEKGCQPLTNDDTLLSSFSAEATSNVMFIIDYKPTDAINAKVTAVLIGTGIGGSGPLFIPMESATNLISDFYMNQDPNNSSAPPFSRIYINCNYHGRTAPKTFPMSAGDQAAFPTVWKVGGVTDMPVLLVPPPLMPATSGIPPPPYLDNCLRFGQDDPLSVEPLQVFTHFFFFPSSDKNEVVISWKFSVLPTQGSGGLTTLVGLYEVERDAVGGGKTRRLIVSTLTLYTMSLEDAVGTSKFYNVVAQTDMFAYRGTPVYPNTSGPNVYASVYSFVLVDFENNWPFSARLRGPASTVSDTAGTCVVQFLDTTQADTSVSTLIPASNTIPAWRGLYPVFTPRSYTRVQAATTTLNPTSGGDTLWTSMNLFGSNTPSLLDSDLVVMAMAGRSSIIGLLLVYSQGPLPPQTLLLTMRFGDVTATSRYSLPNLNSTATGYANPTRMYTFFLTPEPEETGGGTASKFFAHSDIPITSAPPNIIKQAFPDPHIALAPVQTDDVSSWATGPSTNHGNPNDTPVQNNEAQLVAHQMRTSWGSEVFTGCLIPSTLYPPIRFFRMPADNGVSVKGSDDVWVWGRDTATSSNLRCVPLFFDNLGAIISLYLDKPTPINTWISSAGVTCPPTATQATAGIDHRYGLLGTSNTYVFAEDSPWNINPAAVIQPLDSPLQLVGRMCQTQGYQDGLLYRARPYVFAAPGDPENIPPAISTYLADARTNRIAVTDLQSMALALSSLADPLGVTDPVSYKDALPLIGVGSIDVLLGAAGSVHPVHPNFFALDQDREILWVGSESGVPMLPGGYRTLACSVNPRANTLLVRPDIFPTGCPDYPLAQTQAQRKPLPICVIYQYTTAPRSPQLEMHLYDVRMTRSGYAIQVISDTTVQMNGGLAMMAELGPHAGSAMGYPGFNGGPAVVYAACTGAPLPP